MLAPQFTTRRILLLTAICGVFFLVLAMAAQGHLWAVALAVGVGSVAIVLLAFALFFQVSFVVAKLLGLLKAEEAPVSPFAKDTAPPVLVPPTNPVY